MQEAFDRRNLTFKQAEGLEDLPRILEKTEISPKLRALLWKKYYGTMLERGGDKFNITLLWYVKSILSDYFVEILHKPISQFRDRLDEHRQYYEKLFTSGIYGDLLEHIQYTLRHESCPPELREGIEQCFIECSSPWRIIHERKNTCLIANLNEQEHQTLETAYQDLKNSGFGGGQAHLIKASQAFADGKWSDCIRESITAVEAVAKKIANKPNADLGDALTVLKKTDIKIHAALELALIKLYAYTSAEVGIRHALTEETHNCDQADAQFMLGACASFVSYLLNKAKIA